MPLPLRFGDCDNCKLQGDGCGPIAWKGPITAPVVVLGQSPGAEELLYGTPFCGQSGKMLDDMLRKAGFDPSQVLYYNAVQCQSPKDEEIGIKPIECCRPNVEAVLRHVPRKLVIALGNEAWATLHHIRKIGGARVGCGRIARVDWLSNDNHTCWAVWSVHPAFVMRTPSWKEEFENSFKRAHRLFTVGEPERPNAVIHPVPATSDAACVLIERAGATGEVVVDIETDNIIQHGVSPNYQEDEILGTGIAWTENGVPHSVYIPFTHKGPYWEASDWASIYQSFKQHIFSGNTLLVAQNGMFDARFLKYQYGLDMQVGYDTMIAHRMIDENKPHSLKFMARHWINCPDWDIIDKLPPKERLSYFSVEQVAEYCCYDCVYTLLLKDLFDEVLYGQPYEKTLRELDFPLFRELTEIGLRGMLVDMNVVDGADVVLTDEIQASGQDVDTKSGWAGKPLPHNDKRKKNGELSAAGRIGVNPGSGKDVGFLLYTHFKVPPPTRKKLYQKDGSPRTDAETMDHIFSLINSDHPAMPFIDAMMHYRSLATLYGDIIKGTRKSVYSDGRVHTNYGFNPKTDDLKSPVTGRLSSNSPNMQNVKEAFRPLFIPSPGNTFVEADYSQLEVRVWAYHSQDKKLLDAILSGDYHRRTASVALGKPESEITKEERAMSKVLTFGGVMYGGDTSVVKRMLKCSEETARSLLDGMFAEFSDGKRWLDSQVEHAKEYGWVETAFHRRRRLPEIKTSKEYLRSEAERQAMNSPIQGGAAEITNFAIIRLAKRFREELDGRAFIVNTVHDSILVECPPELKDTVAEMMKETMCEPPFPEFNVPLEVEIKTWNRWGGEVDYEKMRMRQEDE